MIMITVIKIIIVIMEKIILIIIEFLKVDI